MKKLKIYTLASFLSVFLFSSLNAVNVSSEIIQQIKTSSVRVTQSGEPSPEEIARDLLNTQNEEKKDSISRRDQPVKLRSVQGDDEEEVVNNNGDFIPYYNTSHRAAYHRPISVSKDGRIVEIEDKSLWEVHSWDASTVIHWKPYEVVVIAPNTNIFTKWSYPFKLINLDSREIVKANMKFTPEFTDPNIDVNVHWIEQIDYNKRMLRLEDGSIWNITWSDGAIMNSFDCYNIVVIGTNDG